MTEIQARIVDEAKSWLGTRYHRQANVKGAGVDCAMILVEVYANAGLIERFDPRPYAPDWHLHRSEEKYLEQIVGHADEVEDPQPGDVILIKFGRAFSHSAIVVNYPLVIHAYAAERAVVYGDVSKYPFKGREMKIYRVRS